MLVKVGHAKVMKIYPMLPSFKSYQKKVINRKQTKLILVTGYSNHIETTYANLAKTEIHLDKINKYSYLCGVTCRNDRKY